MLVASACVFDSGRRATIDVNVAAASSYVFRGQTFTTEPVAQLDTGIHLPVRDGGTATVGAFGNLDLSDHVGDAWAARDHGGEFTQLDLLASYGRRIGDFDLSGGLRHYSWPAGEEFPNGRFPATTEAFARAGVDALGCTAAVAVHYDIDEVHGLYVQGELARQFGLGKSVFLEARAWLGWSDGDHGWWLYSTHAAGLADLGGEIAVRWDCDDVTAVRLGVLGSTILDSAYRDWFATGVDADVVWATIGVGWHF
ncbi:MAG: hypothetical protein U1E73_12990 [Planctomycetota bacterium]